MSTAWLFPGQGTQNVGMGKTLADSSAAAREVFDRADEALGEALSRVMFEGPADELILTQNAQPAILTCSVAALAALREQLPELSNPSFAAGHSLGEYSALVAAGALSFEDALRLVRIRGQAMQAAVPPGRGAMAAIMGGTQEAVSELCRDAAAPEQPVSPANFNAPGQIVIAGDARAVERAAALAKGRKLKAIPLKVSAPFHCALMEPAARAVERALSQLQVSEFRFPVVSNIEARPNTDPRRVAELLVAQVDGPVQWERSIAWMAAQGVDRALEIGPGKVLAGLVRKIAKDLAVLSVAEPEQIADAATFLK